MGGGTEVQSCAVGSCSPEIWKGSTVDWVALGMVWGDLCCLRDNPDSPRDCPLSGGLGLAPLGFYLQLRWQGLALSIRLRSAFWSPVLSSMASWAERSRRRAVCLIGAGRSAFSGKMARLFTVKTHFGLSAYSSMVKNSSYSQAQCMRRANAGTEFFIVRETVSFMELYSLLASRVGIFFSKTKYLTEELLFSPFPKSHSAASFSRMTKSL